MPKDAPQRDHSLREVVNGWHWSVRTGVATLQCNVAPTRMLPADLTPWPTVSTQRTALVREWRAFAGWHTMMSGC